MHFKESYYLNPETVYIQITRNCSRSFDRSAIFFALSVFCEHFRIFRWFGKLLRVSPFLPQKKFLFRKFWRMKIKSFAWLWEAQTSWVTTNASCECSHCITRKMKAKVLDCNEYLHYWNKIISGWYKSAPLQSLKEVLMDVKIFDGYGSKFKGIKIYWNFNSCISDAAFLKFHLVINFYTVKITIMFRWNGDYFYQPDTFSAKIVTL